MKAIILTYDQRKPITQLVLSSYDQICNKNEFEFIIPYNKTIHNFKTNNKVTLIKTEQSVYNTMNSLLKDIPDEEFIYWCLDDIYLHKIMKLDVFKSLYNYIKNNKNIPFDAVRLVNHDTLNGKIDNKKNIKIGSEIFYNTVFSLYGFWFHQFLKAKVLKQCFLNSSIGVNYTMRSLDEHRNENKEMYKHIIYVPKNYLCIFGETTRGKTQMTQNCSEALKKYNIDYNESEYQYIPSIFNNRIVSQLDPYIVKLL